MKKTIVQIKDYIWYDANKNDHGIVYFENNPENETNFLSRGQEKYLGKISEVINIDTSNNYKLKIDNGEYIWRDWQFSEIHEKDVTDGIIEADFFEGEEKFELGEPDKNPLYKEKTETENKSSIEFKSSIIRLINEWRLNYNLGTVITSIVLSDKNNIEEYKHNLELACICIQNELEELK